MKRITNIITLVGMLAALALSAAVPIRWTVETSRVQPAQFESFKGESITLEASMQSYGKPLAIEGEPHLYWQTNGMGSAWWTAPAAVSSNVLSATWTPEMDVGANAYTCFLGVTGSIYRAAFQLRVRHAPGDIPNALPLPTPTIDFAKIEVLNAPYYTQGETDAQIDSSAADTLAAAKAYTDAHAGGVDTNTVIAIANEAARTNAAIIVRSIVTQSDEWVRPGLWGLGYRVTPTSWRGIETNAFVSGLRLMAHVESVASYSTEADIFPTLLDETSMELPDIVAWGAPDGGTVSPTGHFVAPGSGVYHVTAKDDTGVMRSVQVPITTDRDAVRTRDDLYVGDASNSVRKAINDQAAAILASAEFVSSNSYNGVGYSIYNTFRPLLVANNRVGYDDQFAISPHVLVTAAHWNWTTLGPITFTDAQGNSATVNRIRRENLKPWALANGFTEAEVAACQDIGDISLVVCDDSAAVPDGCIPFLVSDEQWQKMVGNDGEGVTAWAATQANGGYALPLVLKGWAGKEWNNFSYAPFATGLSREDIRNRSIEMGNLYPMHGGDSGHPIFALYGDKMIALSECHWATGGPYFPAAFKILKAYVESVGDQVKTIEE